MEKSHFNFQGTVPPPYTRKVEQSVGGGQTCASNISNHVNLGLIDQVLHGQTREQGHPVVCGKLQFVNPN